MSLNLHLIDITIVSLLFQFFTRWYILEVSTFWTKIPQNSHCRYTCSSKNVSVSKYIGNMNMRGHGSQVIYQETLTTYIEQTMLQNEYVHVFLLSPNWYSRYFPKGPFIFKRRRHFRREGSKICQICRRIVVKNMISSLVAI